MALRKSVGASGLAFDARSGALLVSETFTGLIKRVPLAP
jgi:hypothetical protein